MNEEMLAKLKEAKSVEEIIRIAKEYGAEVTEEKAKELLTMLTEAGGELSDDALTAVAGGASSTPSRSGLAVSSANKKDGGSHPCAGGIPAKQNKCGTMGFLFAA